MLAPRSPRRVLVRCQYPTRHAWWAPTKAAATSPTADPTPGNNTGTALTTLTGISDLSLTKSASPLVVTAGQQVTYTLTVRNAGSSTARNVTIADELPPAFTFSSASPSCGAPAGSTLSCTIAAIAARRVGDGDDHDGGPAGFPGGDVVNRASVSSPNLDPDPSNNAADFTNTTSAAADVSITKVVAPDPVAAGDTATWTVTVSNAGPSNAADVAVADPLPAGVDPATVTATATAGTCTPGATVTCAIGTVAGGGSVTVTITARVDPGTTGRLTNVATVTSSTLDPTDSNNVATVGSAVDARADLTVTKSPSANPVRVGEVEAFTIIVRNNGPSTATDVKLLDHWDARWLGVPGPLCTFIEEDIECNVIDELPPGGEAGFIVFLYPFDDSGTYLNTVSVSTATPESITTNNRFSVPVTVDPPLVDIHLRKTAPAPAVAGGTFEFVLAADNEGPSIAEPVTVTDTLPAGLVPRSATVDSGGAPFGGTCAIDGQVVTCTLETLFPPDLSDAGNPLRDVRTVTITGDVDPAITGTSVTNTATASADGEAAPTDNTASATAPIERIADVSVVKTVETATVTAGGGVVFDIAVSNAGPSAATNAVLTDPLPAGVTFDPALSDSPCAAAGGIVTCALGTVAAGATTVIRVGGRLAPDTTAPTIENTASFTSDAGGPIPSNTTTTPVEQSADLAVTKVAAQEAIAAGDQGTFTVTVTNNGPSTARGLTLADAIPPGTTLVEVRPAAPLTCTSLPCAVGDLGPGDSVSIDVVLAVPASFPPGTITNTATVDSPTPDPNPQLRTASADTGVVRRADITVTKAVATDPVVAGQPVTYNLTISNAGPSDAVDATITDALPAGTSLIGGSVGGGPDCVATDTDNVPTVSCVAPLVAVGQTVTGTLTLATDAALTGQLSNTVVVGANALDSRDAGNVSTAEALLVTPSDVAVTVTADQEQVRPGDRASFTVVVTNNGPQTAVAVALVNTLAPEISVPAAAGGGTSRALPRQVPTDCLPTGVTATCLVGDLAVGASRSFVFAGTVAAGTPAGTQLTDAATVTFDGVDSVQANNQSTDAIVVVVVAQVPTTTTTVPPAATTTTTTPRRSATSTPRGRLPATGTSIGVLLIVAGGALVGGQALRDPDRRRRRRAR